MERSRKTRVSYKLLQNEIYIRWSYLKFKFHLNQIDSLICSLCLCLSQNKPFADRNQMHGIRTASLSSLSTLNSGIPLLILMLFSVLFVRRPRRRWFQNACTNSNGQDNAWRQQNEKTERNAKRIHRKTVRTLTGCHIALYSIRRLRRCRRRIQGKHYWDVGNQVKSFNNELPDHVCVCVWVPERTTKDDSGGYRSTRRTQNKMKNKTEIRTRRRSQLQFVTWRVERIGGTWTRKIAEMVKPHIYVNVKYNICELLFRISPTLSSAQLLMRYFGSRSNGCRCYLFLVFAFLFKRSQRQNI